MEERCLWNQLANLPLVGWLSLITSPNEKKYQWIAKQRRKSHITTYPTLVTTLRVFSGIQKPMDWCLFIKYLGPLPAGPQKSRRPSFRRDCDNDLCCLSAWCNTTSLHLPWEVLTSCHHNLPQLQEIAIIASVSFSKLLPQLLSQESMIIIYAR